MRPWGFWENYTAQPWCLLSEALKTIYKINKIARLGGKSLRFHQSTSWGFAQQNVLMSLKKDLNIICSSCKNTFFSLLFLCWRFMVRFLEDLNGGKSSSALVTRLLQGDKWGYLSPEEGLGSVKAGLFFTIVSGDLIKGTAPPYIDLTSPTAGMTQA